MSAFHSLTGDSPLPSGDQLPTVNRNDLAQLIGPASRPFDLLYLPAPWHTLPLGSHDPIPAPVVATIRDLAFEWTDYFSATDRMRHEAAKLARVASALVFPSATLREAAVQRLGMTWERTHVIYPASGAAASPADVRAVRQKYALPERFAFILSGNTPRKNAHVLIEALTRLADRGGVPLPVVAAGYGFDDVLPASAETRRYQHMTAERLAETGLARAGHFQDLGIVDAEDIPALIAAATVVVAANQQAGGLTYPLLDAIALGTPIAYSRIPAFTEQLGTNDQYGLSFDPADADELAAVLTTIADQPTAAQSRADAVRATFGTRTPADEAADYWTVFEQMIAKPWRTRPHLRTVPLVKREQRVAWIINHTTLRDAELPALNEMGFEVYTSKQLIKMMEFRSGSVDYSADEQSTLPKWVLDRLNRHNFYEDGLPPDILALVNAYFGTVFVSIAYPPIRDMLNGYHGRILLRVFGREAPSTYGQYMQYFNSVDKHEVWQLLWQNQHKFWFNACYPEILDAEEKLLVDCGVSLPLALPERTLRVDQQGLWRGTDQRIMFVCPSIALLPDYYGRIYRDFKQHFGHLPHLIAGSQPKPVDDPLVVGFASDDQMQAWFRDLRVMFYHSREPRHIHYHPLEAVAYGMPLIFMRGGLTDKLMGDGDKPGACDTYAEAEIKLRRVLDGDEAFTQSVIASQRSLLDTFRKEYMLEHWQDAFIDGVLAAPLVRDIPTYSDWVTAEALPASRVPAVTPTAGRSVGIYHLLPTTLGVDKFTRRLIDTAARHLPTWTFTVWEPVDPEPISHRRRWPRPIPANLHVRQWDAAKTLIDQLKLRSRFPKQRRKEAELALQKPVVVIEAQSNKQFDPSNQKHYQKAFLRRTGVISRWRHSRLYLTNRFLRVGSELVIIPAQYLREAVFQRTFKPHLLGMHRVLADARLGRKFLNSRFGRWIEPDVADLRPVVQETPIDYEFEETIDGTDVIVKRTMTDLDFLTNPPPPPHLPLLPEQPIGGRYLTITELEAIIIDSDVAYFPQPFHLLSPNLDLDTLPELPIVVNMGDMRHLYTSVEDHPADVLTRQLMIWGRVAHTLIFGSELMRQDAVRCCGIPAAKTVVIPAPALTLPHPSSVAERQAVRDQLKLPTRYIFTLGSAKSEHSTLTILQGWQMLRWRGVDVPPLVIGGVGVEAFTDTTTASTYVEAVRQFLKDHKLKAGQDYLLLGTVDDAALPIVYQEAAAVISLGRFGTGLDAVTAEALACGTPVIAAASPLNLAELGTEDTYALLVPPDDPAAIADAIADTLTDTAATVARVERGQTWINGRTWEKTAADYLRVWEQVAAQRSPKTDYVPRPLPPPTPTGESHRIQNIPSLG